MLNYGRVELKKNPLILGDESRWDINLKLPLSLNKTMKKVPTLPTRPTIMCVAKKDKKTLWLLLWMGFNFIKATATLRRRFTF